MRSNEQHDSSEAAQAIMGLRRELMGCVWPRVVGIFIFWYGFVGGIVSPAIHNFAGTCCWLWQSRRTARDPLSL